MRTRCSVIFAAWIFLAVGGSAQDRSPIQWPLPAPPSPPPLESPWIDHRELLRKIDSSEATVIDLRPDNAWNDEVVEGAISAAALLDLSVRGNLPTVRCYLESQDIDLDTRDIVLLANQDDLANAGRVLAIIESLTSRMVFLYTGERTGTDASEPSVRRGARRFPPIVPVVSRDWVRESATLGGVQILDVRGDRDPSQTRFPKAFESAHIPGSLPLGTSDLRRWLDGPRARESLRDLVASFGPRASTPIALSDTLVIYGHDSTDSRASLAYLLLRHAGADVRWFRGGWSAWVEDRRNPTSRIISTDTLRSLLERNEADLRDYPREDLVILDLRTERDFEVGHVPGAESAPYFPKDLEGILARHWPNADRAKIPLILYCYGVGCVRSWKATKVAPLYGFHDIRWYRGGVPAWRKAGLSLATSLPVESREPP